MKYLKTIFATLLLLGAVSFSYAQKINDIDIRVKLNADGSGDLTEVWDVIVESGTEWYVPVGNLKNMSITDFRVFENGREFVSEGRRWDVDRSAEAKNGRCGIVEKRDGLELCWGQGGRGPHVWTVQYRIEGLVQAYDDYDGFNFMFVNPGMGNGPEHVRLVLENAAGDSLWTRENVKVWGFGHNGEINVTGGAVVQETAGKMSRDARVITMVRFDKGLFSPAVVNSGSFSKLQDRAMEGSDYEDDDDGLGFAIFGIAFLSILFGIIIYVLVCKITGHVYNKDIYGKSKITGWYRDIPLEGNIPAVNYIYKHGSLLEVPDDTSIIGVYFLKWIMDGSVKVIPDAKSRKKLNLDFSGAAPEFLDDAEKELYDMAVEAAGENRILENSELSRWGRKNDRRFVKIPEKISNAGFSWLAGKGYMKGLKKCTDTGKAEACHVVEFRNFLKDFTLSGERGAAEAGLWKEYLVFAQLFGIADKVAKQFKDMYPAEFGQIARECGLDDVIFYHVILNNHRITRDAYTAALTKNAERSGGGGGFTSFGGGGGFSGGGFGGGSR